MGPHLVQLVPFFTGGSHVKLELDACMLPTNFHQDGADNLDMQNKVQL